MEQDDKDDNDHPVLIRSAWLGNIILIVIVVIVLAAGLAYREFMG